MAHRFIKEHLFSPITVVWALIVGAIGILIAEKYRPEAKITELDQLGMGQALMIGCFQCLALWPGMSRSASTIVGGMFSGLDRKVAAEYLVFSSGSVNDCGHFVRPLQGMAFARDVEFCILCHRVGGFFHFRSGSCQDLYSNRPEMVACPICMLQVDNRACNLFCYEMNFKA